MRFLKALLAFCAAAVLAVSTFAVAGAFISDSGGQLIQLSAAPPSVALNALESLTSAFAFDETQGFALTSPLTVDITAPGSYAAFPIGRSTIPAGTLVDSHLIHSDPARAVHFPARRAGSITVADDILGVIVTTKNLAASDYLGAPGTVYSGKFANRGLDTGQDTMTLSEDHRTVSFDVQTNPTGMDEIRVVTAHTNRLVTTITDSPDPVQTGDNVTYIVTVTNLTPLSAPDVHVADEFPGATLVSADGPGGPCPGTSTVTCALGSIAAGGHASATIVVTSPATPPEGGTIVNTATSPPGADPAATEVTTVAAPVLDTTISDAPDPVTAGNDVQYVLTVTNNGVATVSDPQVTDTLPLDTTLVSATAPGGCSGSATVDCALGPLAVGDSAQATLIVTSPSSVPESGTITDSAIASPGDNAAVDEVTTVQAPAAGEASGFVSPGDSITIPGDDPATITLPDTGDGAPIVVTQGNGTFCNGPCTGTVTTISAFPGYDDPNHPIHLTLVYNFPSSPTSLKDAGKAYFLEKIYKNSDPENPNAGVLVSDCTSPGSGSAIPSPCVDSRDLVETTLNTYVVTFDIVYVSGDPSFGKH